MKLYVTTETGTLLCITDGLEDTSNGLYPRTVKGLLNFFIFFFSFFGNFEYNILDFLAHALYSF